MSVDVVRRRFTVDEFKLPLYAGAGIPECWIVNVEGRAIESHTNPSGAGYGSIRTFVPGEWLSPLAFPDLSVTVAEIFA